MDEVRMMQVLAGAAGLERKGFPNWHQANTEILRKKVKLFKRKNLGLCGKETVKSLDEIAHSFFEVGIVDSIEEGKELIPSLVGKIIDYSLFEGSGSRDYAKAVYLSFQSEKKDSYKMTSITYRKSLFNWGLGRRLV